MNYYHVRFCGRMAELVDALVSGTSGSNTLEVRVFLRPPDFWGCSSADRALRSHRRGRGFESHQLHQKNKKTPNRGIFFILETILFLPECKTTTR